MGALTNSLLQTGIWVPERDLLSDVSQSEPGVSTYEPFRQITKQAYTRCDNRLLASDNKSLMNIYPTHCCNNDANVPLRHAMREGVYQL